MPAISNQPAQERALENLLLRLKTISDNVYNIKYRLQSTEYRINGPSAIKGVGVDPAQAENDHGDPGFLTRFGDILALIENDHSDTFKALGRIEDAI